MRRPVLAAASTKPRSEVHGSWHSALLALVASHWTSNHLADLLAARRSFLIGRLSAFRRDGDGMSLVESTRDIPQLVLEQLRRLHGLTKDHTSSAASRYRWHRSCAATPATSESRSRRDSRSEPSVVSTPTPKAVLAIFEQE